MHYEGSFNALIMACNALCELMNNCNQCIIMHCYTFIKYNALKHTANKPANIIMHFNFGYNYL